MPTKVSAVKSEVGTINKVATKIQRKKGKDTWKQVQKEAVKWAAINS